MSNPDFVNRRVLVVAPHPDDAVYFMGGTLLKTLESGVLVDLWCMSGGERGGILSFLGRFRNSLLKKRSAELRAGLASFPNIRIREFFFPDGSLHVEEAQFPLLDQNHTESGTPSYSEIYLPEAEPEKSLFLHPDHLRCGSGMQEWLVQRGYAKGARLLYYHSKVADHFEMLDEHDCARVDRLIRHHESQYSWTAWPPFLLHFGEKIRRRWLRKQGKRGRGKFAESFRVKALGFEARK